MKKYILLCCIVSSTFLMKAEEGMLIPSLIAAFQSDMKAAGMKLSAEQIYSINNSSLKDAILQFGGGCTAEIISKQGLILTNHHCGYYNIQQHSSLENDYLKNGFWAKSQAQELPNQGLTATRIVRIDDVTKEVLFGTEGLTKEARLAKIAVNIRQLTSDKTTNTHYKYEIQDFDYGNSFYAMTSEIFLDVRLVGTPPNSIGKFGGDTDNWVWPRHTGDFSVFRIYTGPDNKPAPYSTANIPYTPIHSLIIDAGKKQKGDFTMVYGFPGQTEQHLVSGQLNYIIEKERTARISIRNKVLTVIDSEMRTSDKIRIKYAAKQASIANSYKKWIGQVQGLKELHAVEVKKSSELRYTNTARTNPNWNQKYGSVVDEMNAITEKYKYYDYSNSIFMEYLNIGAEFYKNMRVIDDLVTNYDLYEQKKEMPEKVKKIKASLDKFFKDYDKHTDQLIFNAVHDDFIRLIPDSLIPSEIKELNTLEWSKLIYTKSIFVEKEKIKKVLSNLTRKKLKKLTADPAFKLYKALISSYRATILPKELIFQETMEDLLKVYVEGKCIMFPNEKHWPDANSTLRLTYGKLEGSAPKDGMSYGEHTNIDGIIEKNKTGNPDFELLPRMIELHKNKAYGSYAQDGELWVCYTASNHTTGGNSGSPVLNENGELIGINFDRTWESTMSDYMFDPSRCRNVVCDIRYVLWVIDIYSGANHLIKELEISKN